MNTSEKQAKKRCSESYCTERCGAGQSVLDILYDSYREQHPVNSEEIGRQFVSLADILGKLPLKEHDRVWDLTCDLCIKHEKNGFLEGVHTGVSHCLELLGR